MWVFLLRHAALISFIQNKISPFPMGLDMGHCLSKVLQRKTLVHPWTVKLIFESGLRSISL